MIDEAEVRRAADIIAGSREFMVFGHHFPDGDAIGSVLGLSLMLAGRGHKVQASWPEPFDTPAKYAFMPGAEMLKRPSELVPAGVAVVLDCANKERLEELEPVALGATGLVNIDHHPDNTRFGGANPVDPESSATAQLIYDHAAGLGLSVTPDAAICLYTGIVTDTGRFQYSSTGADTLEAAAGMVRMGVSPNEVFSNVYQSDSLAYMRLSGAVLSRAEYVEHLGLVRAAVSRSDFETYGVAMNETEDLIDLLRALRGHRIAALFKELPDGRIRVSLRSRADVDIGSVARRMGGGGHRVAAGYTSRRERIEAAIEELEVELGGRRTGS